MKQSLLNLLIATGILYIPALPGYAVSVEKPLIRQAVIDHVRTQVGRQVGLSGSETVHVNIRRVPGGELTFPKTARSEDIVIDVTSALEDYYSERGIARVTVKSRATGRRRSIGVPFTVDIRKPVWVVQSPVPASTPLSEADFTLEVREVARYAGYVAGQETDLSDYMARVNLQPGDLLDTRKLIIPPDVRRNNTVQIMIDAGNGISITVMGKALADGRIGEIIRVKHHHPNRRRPRYFNAQVVDKNQVLVHM